MALMLLVGVDDWVQVEQTVKMHTTGGINPTNARKQLPSMDVGNLGEDFVGG